jgi:tripartite-type tricarboxylate transporter receptor subunit TctC
MNRRQSLASLGAAWLAPDWRAAAAQTPVSRVLVGFAAGGTGDVIARGFTEAMRRAGSGMYIVENRPGAGGRLAVKAFKSVPADGSTLLVTPGWVLTLAPHTDKTPAFDPFGDLVPVGAFSAQDYALAVGPGSPAKTLAEYVRWIKDNPHLGQYASAGVGSMAHIVGAMFERSAGIKLQGIPYKGAAPSLQDLQAGHVPANIGALGDMVRMHREGKLRVLATTGARRSKFLPEVPSFEEAGFKAVRFTDWTGAFAPAKTPPAWIARDAKLLAACVNDPAFMAVVERLGAEAVHQGPEQLAARLKRDSDAMRELVLAFGLKEST